MMLRDAITTYVMVQHHVKEELSLQRSTRRRSLADALSERAPSANQMVRDATERRLNSAASGQLLDTERPSLLAIREPVGLCYWSPRCSEGSRAKGA